MSSCDCRRVARTIGDGEQSYEIVPGGVAMPTGSSILWSIKMVPSGVGCCVHHVHISRDSLLVRLVYGCVCCMDLDCRPFPLDA